MGIKLNEKTKLNVPGSGSYNPTHGLTRVKSVSFSMGLKLKGAFAKGRASVPGPGTYKQSETRMRSTAPSFGFGTSKRMEITGPKVTHTPGPGDYKVPVKISNAQDFALPNREQ